MKKLATLALIGLTTISAARADYNCEAKNGDVMTVGYLNDGLKTNVTINHTFSGQNEIYSGIYVQKTGEYILHDNAGDPVGLKIVQPIDHGGRCGRCEPSKPSLVSYAKLTVNQEVKEFKCYPDFLK